MDHMKWQLADQRIYLDSLITRVQQAARQVPRQAAPRSKHTRVQLLSYVISMLQAMKARNPNRRRTSTSKRLEFFLQDWRSELPSATAVAAAAASGH